MIDCDNMKCRFNHYEKCVNIRLCIRNGVCVSSELKMHRQKRTKETDINHTPVKNTMRNKILK